MTSQQSTSGEAAKPRAGAWSGSGRNGRALDTGGAAYVDSYYAATRNGEIEAEPLRTSTTADVCIVGGGVTGCSAALHLARRGYSVCLLEGRRIGWGASGRSGGQIGPGLSADISLVEARLGLEAARGIWEVTRESVDLVRSLVAEHGIECDLKTGHVHAATNVRQLDELKRSQEHMVRAYGHDGLSILDREQMAAEVVSDRYVGGARQHDGGHLHPLNYTLGLGRAAQAAGARLHECSPVTDLAEAKPHRVRTEQSEVIAGHVLLCGNAYLPAFDAAMARRILPVGTYIIATEPLGEEGVRSVLPGDAAVSDLNYVLDYYRLSADRRMLFGGRVSYTTYPPRNLSRAMARRMQRVFPQLEGARIDYTWGGLFGITSNRAPHFGRLNRTTLFAQGFSGHGMALGTMAGKLMAEAVSGRGERFDLFARVPHAPFPGGPVARAPLVFLASMYYRLRDVL